MGKAIGYQPCTDSVSSPATSRVTTLISFAGIVTVLRHRIRECLSRDESGWAFENIRYLTDGQIDVSDYLAVLLTEVLTGNQSYMRHPCPQSQSQSVLRHMGLDDDCARELNREMFFAALERILDHLPQSAFNDRGEFDFLLTRFDLIAIRNLNGTHASTAAGPVP
ncbi:hypothetical protein HDG34_003273 [Paraburkholderia sp. HC6.4b]|uniref:hypothetical protein n=1 Tax=unclassified Paraburkholderia TaxID=2615204 RepID=UPI00160C9F20|nr:MULTISPECIES: hypothetical protein [unclassified Paraburkholderia]MBB5409332.1 hypothetical protein [Paraburkholderia sp. HC6.4b]MBB5451060.1 hypothetical protein [Paraburkholderia sp. Kb1A]